jgi:asparagine synthase (glutamine-hydrolysing)
MLDALVHRGPDSSGIVESPGVTAGIRRLRVVDLESGDQPIANEDGTVEVVFNGEIYNHRDLRAELMARGHRFRTRSDTEVLVHLWEEAGPEMVRRLDGMYAFCIADRRKREAFLARDPLGIKPLYLRRDGGGVAFASETAAFRRLPGVRLDPDPVALFSALALQFVPGEGTFFRGVTRLPPGGTLHLRDGALVRGRAWAVPPAEPSGRFDEREEAEALYALLRGAVRRQREADVPVGVFLSGGVDSTAVAWMLARESAGAVESFSVGFEGDDAFDERRWARLAAERIGTTHHEIAVRADDVADVLPRAIDHLAEPVTDPALLPTWVLAEFARARVTVALTGEGADELFGGYRRLAFQERYGWVGAIPGAAAGARLAARFRGVPHRISQALLALATRDPVDNHRIWAMTASPALASSLVEPGLWSSFLHSADGAFGHYFEGRSGLDARLRADLREWLPHLLLAKVDGATMAHSLEARVPFLSVDLVERAARWPSRFKIRGAETKRLLRAALRGKVPDEILDRPKRGFDLPLDRWIDGPLRRRTEEVLRSDVWARWPGLRRDAVGLLLDDHLAGRVRAGLPLFLLLSTGLFLERHA